jgi:putative methanogenesis marker protein 2
MLELNLEELVSELKGYMGITRKGPIADVVHSFPLLAEQMTSMEVLADFGEDAAVLSLSTNPQDDGILLLAADGIMSSLLDDDPYWAGYCAVLVNLHDIAAMGGVPLALVDVISVKTTEVLTKLTKGMNDACTKFGVPIVGGHLHPDTEFNAVDVAILGIAKRSSVVYSHSAQVGDKIIFAMDLDGTVHPNSRFSWDTTQHKSPDLVRHQLMIMADICNAGLVHSGKDISNPGTLGTLGMLLESSKKGAVIDLNKIPKPDEKLIEFKHWLKVYQGCGFVVTCDEKYSEQIIDKFKSVGLTGEVAGEITEERKLIIQNNSDNAVLFDFENEDITGI